MSTITTRAGKGSPLTNTELDSNFTNLNDDKIESVVEDTTPQLGGDLDVNGHLVAGRNIATDGTKLDGIEAGADVTDTANVTAAGALMDSELTNITAVKALNQGVATTDSPTFAGIDVTGTAIMDGLTVDGAGTGKIGNVEYKVISAFDTTNPLPSIGRSSGAIGGGGTGTLVIQGRSDSPQPVIIATNDTPTAMFANNGDISFYEDTGTTPALIWDASAQSLNVDGPITADGLTVESGSGSSIKNISSITQANIRLGSTYTTGTGGNNKDWSIIQSYTAYGDLLFRQGSAEGNDPRTSGVTRLNLGNNGDISFYEDTGTTAKFFWDASAESLGIGTSSPSSMLHLRGASEPSITLEDTSVPNKVELRGLNYGFGIEINDTEAMRIDSSGNLLVGTTNTTPSAEDGFAINAGAGFAYFSRASGDVLNLNRRTDDGDILRFRKNGTTVGSIGTAGGDAYIGTGDTGIIFNDFGNQIRPTNAGSTNDATIDIGTDGHRFKDLYLSGGVITSSDYRLKNDIQPMESSTDKIKALNLVNFAWNDSGEREDGFIAHELQAVIPSAVRGEKDAVDEEGEAQYQGVDPLKLIPVLTKALQEALVRIDELEAKLP